MKYRKTILMVRPAAFGYNPETAVNNSFQQAPQAGENAAAQAQAEFDEMVRVLRGAGVSVLVLEDPPSPQTPDAVFPNNWISFEENGHLVTYPMFAPVRRLERNPALLEQIRRHFAVRQHTHLEHWETQSKYLEGTGSMVLDRPNRIAYACLSPRTDPEVLADFCGRLNFKSELFRAYDAQGDPVYHTNVVMAIGLDYIVLCLDSVHPEDRAALSACIENSGKVLVPISLAQMEAFAGNMLEVFDEQDQAILVLSQTAYQSLHPAQVLQLEAFARLLPVSIPTIERLGGGSVRCMMAETW